MIPPDVISEISTFEENPGLVVLVYPGYACTTSFLSMKFVVPFFNLPSTYTFTCFIPDVVNAHPFTVKTSPDTLCVPHGESIVTKFGKLGDGDGVTELPEYFDKSL